MGEDDCIWVGLRDKPQAILTFDCKILRTPGPFRAIFAHGIISRVTKNVAYTRQIDDERIGAVAAKTGFEDTGVARPILHKGNIKLKES